MGRERLSRLFARASFAAVAALAVACSSPKAAPVAAELKKTRHLQIVHAMQTPKRRALVESFKQRNAGRRGEWTVNEEALALSLTVIDPFAGFMRRARISPSPSRPGASAAASVEDAAASARDFVRRNSDLLGLPRHVVPGLAEHVRPVEAVDHASPRAAHVVRFDAPFASKGFEGYKEVDNLADIEVFVDDDGEVSSFVNLSRIHPRLTLDTQPRLEQDDPAVTTKLVGRTVFAFVDSEPGAAELARPGVRNLRRIPLGQLRAEEVTHVQLVIHVSTGPQLAWLAYRLGYFVELAKPVPATDDDPATGAPRYFFFRYVVDADTGDVLEDARVPLAVPADSP